MGFLAYQLLYVQLPLILFPLPKQDFSEFTWSDVPPSIGMYYYNENIITQFETQKYLNRSILGEEDFFFLSGAEEYDSIPYSYMRTMSGDYKLLHLHFDRKLDWGTCSGGIFGSRDIGEFLKGYGSFSFPFILNGNISASLYEDIFDFSINCDYLYLRTTKDKWFSYLKLGDARFGVTHDDKEFISYLFRPRDPIFLVMVNLVGEGLFTEKDFKTREFFIAPVYVLSLDNSVYCVISENPSLGFKSKYGSVEVSTDNSLIALNSNRLKAFIDYSFEDNSFTGAVAGNLDYSFYDNKITPGIEGVFYGEEFDFELSLRILEVEFFWGMKRVTFDGFYDKQLWGMDIFFSF
jgi:hypothetical protein